MRQWRLSLRNFRQSNQLVAGFEVHTGNAAATLSYVADPIGDTTIPLHILWDSNALRTPSLDAVDGAAREFREKYPRSSYPELQANPVNSPDFSGSGRRRATRSEKRSPPGSVNVWFR
jgi:hypothetical protein